MPTTTLRGVVKLFPYRTASVDKRFLTVHRDTLKELEAQLAAAVGLLLPENHAVYEIVQDEDEPPVYIMFSGSTATFAHAVDERSW